MVGTLGVSTGRRNDRGVQVCIAVLRIFAGAGQSKSFRVAAVQPTADAPGA